MHDHHCPLTGTCIGKRNRFLFQRFLTTAVFTCLVAVVLSLLFVLSEPPKGVIIEKWTKDTAQGLMVLCGSIAVFIGAFAGSTHCGLVDDVTTHESLRNRWN